MKIQLHIPRALLAFSLPLLVQAQVTAIRAIQAVSNGITMMSKGFTVVRDLGNNANYADSALAGVHGVVKYPSAFGL